MLNESKAAGKVLLRRELRRRLRRFRGSPAQLREQEKLRRVMDQALQEENPAQVLAFVPRVDEPDIWPVLQALQRRGQCRLAFAKTAANGLGFVWYEAGRALPDLLELDVSGAASFWWQHPRWRVIEPRPACPQAALGQTGQKTIMLCPGLGFWPRGCGGRDVLRLGRGAGFYDRAIATIEQTKAAAGEQLAAGVDWQAWGLGYHIQLDDRLPEVFAAGMDQPLQRLLLAE